MDTVGPSENILDGIPGTKTVYATFFRTNTIHILSLEGARGALTPLSVTQTRHTKAQHLFPGPLTLGTGPNCPTHAHYEQGQNGINVVGNLHTQQACPGRKHTHPTSKTGRRPRPGGLF